jgi:hypothetical protein
VTITSPKALATPTADVLTGGEVEVLCTARKSSIAGAAEVDESGVGIVLLDSAGAELQETFGTPTGNANEYRARFPLTAVPSGRVTFECNARELSARRLLGTHAVQTFVDQGPRITPNEPAPNSAKALEPAVLFDFSVAPERLAPTDPGADVDTVTLTVDGEEWPLPTPTEPGRYRFTIDFKKLIDPPLGSVAVVISAKNKRSTRGTVRTSSYFFAIDDKGPVITVLSPEPTAVVGGQIALRFSVTDEHAGVEPSQLSVRINNKPYPYGQPAGHWSQQGDTFTFLFDSTSIDAPADAGAGDAGDAGGLGQVEAQLTIIIKAIDRVKNEGLRDHILYVDNQAPIVDLDPPKVREMVGTGASAECSDPFDPLGTLPANDLATVLPATMFRALVWERTNMALGATEVFYSGLREDSVDLYLHRDLSRPLIIDTNADGVCDDIPADLRSALHRHRLRGLQPQGAPHFGESLIADPALPTGCKQRKAPEPPPGLCPERTSDLTRVIDHPFMQGAQPIIFADTPGTGVTCTGLSWEIASGVAREGWVCLAARAEDHVGNVGISAPLRVCLDDKNPANGTPDCTASGAPDCHAAGCTLPPRFEDELPSRVLRRSQ